MKKGFTLIELLVVILIIGILAAVALPQYQVAVAKSRYTQLITGADMLKRANQLFYLANGYYTLDMRELDLSLSGCKVAENGRSCTLGKVHCYSNDGTTEGTGALKAIAYCTVDDMFYSLILENSDRWCYAMDPNGTANQVCKSMGGMFKSASNGHNIYLLP